MRIAAVAIVIGLGIIGGCAGRIEGAGDGANEPGAPGGSGSPADPSGRAGDGSPQTGAGGSGGAASAPGSSRPASCPAAPDPGTVVMRRLTHAEYDNTVRDLLGDTSAPGMRFPAEGTAKTGFDNEGAALSLSPLLLDGYASTARTLIDNLMSGSNRKLVVGCDLAAQGAACAESSVVAFARRAFRRPVTATERQRLVALIGRAAAEGEPLETGVKLALRAVLLSPKFLYRVEIDPTPASKTPHPVTAHELATRLSYFLWSTTPDEALMTAADNASLGAPQGLADQVARMLRDKKADGFVRNFGGQWLELRALPTTTRDPKKFPRFDEALKASLWTETETFVKSFLGEPKNVVDLLAAKYTFIDARLAQLYGLTGAPTSGFARIDLGSAPRIGLLTQASVLTTTSTSSGTNPPRRGKWVLGQILCQEPPPPPPDAPALPQEAKPTGSVRQKFEQHRTAPACAACHTLMDPIGFAFESYDATGAYRTKDDNGFTVDPSGKIQAGPFANATELAGLIAADPAFPRCLAERLFVYALGRAENADDHCALDGALGAARKQGSTLPALITALTQTAPFSQRRGEP